MGAILVWIVESKVGRAIAIGFASFVAVAAVLLKVFAAGKAAQREKEGHATLDHVAQRQKVDQDVARLPASELDRELRRWSQ